MDVMMSINTHLKSVLGFRGVFDIGFLFIVKIWHDVQYVSGSTLSSISWQKNPVSPASSYLVDLCPYIWCNNSKENVFLGICFCDFEFSFIFTKNACFCCELCGNVTAFCSLSLNKSVPKHLWKRQVCTKFINLIMENNWSHKSGANSGLYNVAMKGFHYYHAFLFEILLFFSLKKCPSVLKSSRSQVSQSIIIR